MFFNLNHFDRIAIDTECTGLRYLVDRPFGVSISTPDGVDRYFDLREHPQTLRWLNDELPCFNGTAIFANASFDIKMLGSVGVSFQHNLIDDVIVRACCIDEHLTSYSLDYLALKYLGKRKVEIVEALADMFGGRATKNIQMQNLHRAPSEFVAKYAKIDTRLTLELYDWQEDEIREQGIQQICEFERDVMPHLIDMEMTGIRVDSDYAERSIAMMDDLVTESQMALDNLCGVAVNVNSSPQIKKLFDPKWNGTAWLAPDGTVLKSTVKGQPSLDAESLREMTDPRAKAILELRSLIKTRDTFLKGHVLGSAVNGRVYPSINQSKTETANGTGTGRLSYQSPAMQQIPSRNKKVAAIVKPCFLPEEGEVWVDADMASFEVRVFAHLANDQVVIDQYKKDPDTDFHQFVADLTGLPRSAEYSGQANAKQLNLSMIFNSGNGAIANKMGMPWHWDEFTSKEGEHVRYRKAGDDAMRVIDHYHRTLPGVKKLADEAAFRARDRGFVFTKYGRHIRFPDKRKTYKASGLLIQATAADINKENIKLIRQALSDEGRLLLNTHDSYSMSMPRENWERNFERVRRTVERPVLRVPLVLELSGSGPNWWEAVRKDK